MDTRSAWTRAGRRRTAGGAVALLLAGCAVGPDYHRPTLPTADAYTEAPVLTADAAAPDGQRLIRGMDLPARWWELFRSPALDELVRAGLANNPNVAAAQAALQAAVENTQAQRAAYYPSVSAGYDVSRQKVAGTLAIPAANGSYVYNLHTAQVNVAYVPDVFGANRRQVESLQGQQDAQRWNAEATYLTLTANLVLAAVQEGSLRAQIDATRQQIDIQRDILARFRRQYELGQVAVLDVTQQEAALAAVEANLPPLDKQLQLQRDALKALSGQLPAQHWEAEFTLDSLTLPQSLPLTLPSTLVEHRPDVLAAEAQLRSASAGIGVARAARLPSVSLGVDAWGSAAYTLANLFRAGTDFWTLTGGITQPIFDAGALQHREAAARAAYDEAVATYRATVLNAFQNVADALQAIQADADALRLAQRSLAAAQRSLDIARRQLELGDVSALSVRQSEQGVLQARLLVVQAQAGRLSDTVALFQALGGGWWNSAAPVAAAASQP